MQIFSLFLKLLPLYGLIFTGYYANKYFDVDSKRISKLLVYIVTPIVIFYGTYLTNVSASDLGLVVIFFMICWFVSICFLKVGHIFYGKTDGTANILAFAAGSGNIGYFGLPVVLSLFGEKGFGTIVLAILAFNLYFSSVGYYIIFKSKFTAKESLVKTLKHPILIAFILGVIANKAQLALPSSVMDIMDNFKGMYSVLGMMLIGLGLREVNKGDLDIKFIVLSFIGKFIIWPAIVLVGIALDKAYFHLYNTDIYNVAIIASLIPFAAITVSYSIEVNVQPKKTILVVFLSNVFSLFHIPVMAGILIY